MDDAAAFQARIQEALTLHQQGDLAGAQARYTDMLTRWPGQPDVPFLLAVIAMQTERFSEAVAFFDRTLTANPGNPVAWFNRGLALLNLQQYGDAEASFGKAAEIQPDNPDAHNNRAIALRALGRHEDALAEYDKALALQPQSPETLNNRGVTLADLERHQEAADSCAKAFALKPDYVAAYNNHGNSLRMLRQHDAALASFQKAVELDPGDAETYNNRGLLYADLKRHGDALADYAKAIALRPNYGEAFNNRANSLAATRQFDAALADYQNAIALNPGYADARVNLGHLLGDLKRFEDAVASYREAYRLKPQTAFLHGHLLYTQMMNCDWQGIDAELASLTNGIARGERTTSPFPALTLTDDPALQRRAIEVWARATHPLQPNVSAPHPQSPDGKIRVGYFSMDFREHPIAALTAGLFEVHDREKFEVFAFSYGTDAQDAMRQRLERGFDKFIDVRTTSDADVVALARNLQLDIAVDLAGYTKNARAELFALRPAPAQISYLGYPGTLATPHIDYVIADDVVIPPASQAHYTEKVIYLPHFQVNDDKRMRPEHAFTRSELGLPPTGMVFCCFNNTYKFHPAVFSAWMRILQRTEGSVLFLYADSETAVTNLRREAAARGIAPERLVFGKRVNMGDYLARYRAADLFLDTLPYNAGTTAADALWMDLPVLTCTGGAFASRMAASLLRAVDMPELITANLNDYENLAVTLATEAAKLADIKQKLARNRVTSPLFNTKAFARNLENAYAQIAARTRAGLPPEHIFVK